MDALAAVMDHPLPFLDLSVRSAFWNNLNVMHTIMDASEPLLIEAIKRTDGRLRLYYEEHLEEERGHAAWLRLDMIELQGPPVLDLDAAAISGAQYYLIRHGYSEALLGYMLALEARPMALDLVAKLEVIHKVGVSCLRHHAENDAAHRDALMAEIEACGASIITENAAWTAKRLAEVLGHG